MHPSLPSRIWRRSVCPASSIRLGSHCLTQTGASHILNDTCSVCRPATSNIKPPTLMVAKKMSLCKAFQETKRVKPNKCYSIILFPAYPVNTLFKEELMFIVTLRTKYFSLWAISRWVTIQDVTVLVYPAVDTGKHNVHTDLRSQGRTRQTRSEECHLWLHGLSQGCCFLIGWLLKWAETKQSGLTLVREVGK